MDELYHYCHHCLNRQVRISTAYGQVYEGTLLHVDEEHIYLDGSSAYISNKVSVKGFRFRNFVTTLALFDILAIALIA